MASVRDPCHAVLDCPWFLQDHYLMQVRSLCGVEQDHDKAAGRRGLMPACPSQFLKLHMLLLVLVDALDTRNAPCTAAHASYCHD